MQQLYTQAGSALTGTPWNRYPRPQMVRSEWLCLNGDWTFTTCGTTAPIRVPFCPESLLSGYHGPIQYGAEMVYQRTFTLPDHWAGKRILLHFGAVSRDVTVSLNGTVLGRHDNGYLPFTIDLTDALLPGENTLTVTAVHDLSHRHPWGKQQEKRGGMWYTPVSGIWQTVWLEPVPDAYIRRLQIQTGAEYVEIRAEGVSQGTVSLEGQTYPLQNGSVRIHMEHPRLWSPEHPHLYPFTLTSGEDSVTSYFALRTLSIATVDGVPRLCLNGTPYYFHGLLDQGYWSDGLYTPPTPDAYQQDIQMIRELGFNTLRKHIKIEPEQYYYDCDWLGVIVFQDMVNCGDYHYWRDTVLPTIGLQSRKDKGLNRDPETRRNFLGSMEETVSLLSNHPCICLWTIFNEGWGQFDANAAFRQLKELDPSRFVNATSGWFHQGESDLEGSHIYFAKQHLGRSNKPQMITEFGGYAWKLPEHSYNLEKTYGYKKYESRSSFIAALRAVYEDEILPLIPKGLCGSIYTQVSDIEDETNGLVTYDRKVQKVTPEEFADLSKKLMI